MSFVIINKYDGGHALFVNGFHMPNFVVNKQTMLEIQTWLDKGILTIYSEQDYGYILSPPEERLIDVNPESQEDAQREAEDLINKIMDMITPDNSNGE